MSNGYSKSLAEKIGHFLSQDDWRYRFNEEDGIFRFTLGVDRKIKTISYSVLVYEDSFTVHGDCPVGPETNDRVMMSRVAEFICRANYGLRNGNFGMDFEDGQVEFKSFVDCEGIEPSDAMIRNSIYTVAGMIRRYEPGLLAVLFKDESPEKAVMDCEKKYTLLNKLLGDDACQDDDDHPDMSELKRRLQELVDTEAGDQEGEDESEDES